MARPRPRTAGALLVALALALLRVAEPRAVGAEPRSRSARRVSAEAGRAAGGPQAYLHLMRAELATARGDHPAAEEALQLALVHDPESLHLTLALIRNQLARGKDARVERLLERARELGGERLETLRLSAAWARHRGRSTEAMAALARAHRLAPAELAVALELAALLEAGERADEATRVLLEAAERSPTSTAPLLEAARLEGLRRGPEAAVTLLQRARSRSPADVEVTIRLGAALERLGRGAEALELWATLLEATTPRAGPLFEAARLALLLGRAPRAAEWLSLAEALEPGATTERRIAVLYAAHGPPDEAVRRLERSLALRPGDDELRYWLGRVELTRGRLGPAHAALESVGATSSRHVEARVLLARSLLASGDPARAERAIESALSRHPGDDALLAGWVRLRAARGAREDALAELARRRVEQPSAPALLLAQVQLLFDAGRGEEARRVASSALASGAPREQALPLMVEVLLELDERAAAAELLEREQRIAPIPFAALVVRARSLLGRKSGARELERTLSEARALEPWSPQVAELSASALLGTAPDAARGLVERHLTLHPERWRLHALHAQALAALGDHPGARTAWREAARAARGAWSEWCSPRERARLEARSAEP
jgi:tetratricopeptide (TPR) repeat protein